MNIIARKALEEDLEEMLLVEKAAINIHYLMEVHREFFADKKGEMTVAVNEYGQIMGFGKLTFLYDGSAWAETLRVHPKYQGIGVGNAIWERYMEQCRRENAPCIRMYTGKDNDISRHLAKKNGLDRAYEYSECSCENFEEEKYIGDFMQISAAEVVKALWDIKALWGDYACFNRTFYSLEEPFIRGMEKEYKLYTDGESIMALGSRFMPERGIHIGFIKGNIENCTSFAKRMAKKINSPKITLMHRSSDEKLKEILKSLEFKYIPENLLMLEGMLS